MGRIEARWCAVLACVLLLAPAAASAAATPDPSLRKAANVITIALPVTAIGVSLLHHEDWKGIEEFAVSAGLTVGTAYLLRQSIRDRRPDHSDFHGLTPPDLALADSSSEYLWSRYGWRYGLPAWIASGVVSYALTDAKKNHWYDTLGTGVIAFGINYSLVDRYHAGRVHVAAEPVPGGAMVRLSMNF